MTKPPEPRWRRIVRGVLRWAGRLCLLAAVLLLGRGGYAWATRARPVPPTPIYRGVTYECFKVPAGREGAGLGHVVTVDLDAEGVELFITPVDPEAKAEGWEYHLAYPALAAGHHDLAVAMNCDQFRSRYGRRKSPRIYLPGDLARSGHTLIVAGEVNHIFQHSYLLWFEEQMNPAVQRKPPPKDVVERATWAVGSGFVPIKNGRMNPWLDRHAGERTSRSLFGVDRETKEAYLATFEDCTLRLATELLVQRGATDAMRLDGGRSTWLGLGHEASTVRGGTKIGGLRPVATIIGFRARPLPDR